MNEFKLNYIDTDQSIVDIEEFEQLLDEHFAYFTDMNTKRKNALIKGLTEKALKNYKCEINHVNIIKRS